MANKMILAALAVLRRNPDIKTLPELWDALGRSDLYGFTYANLAGAPVLQSISYEAGRALKARAELLVGKGDPNRKVLLTRYLRALPNGRVLFYFLRPTKGWRSESIEASEVEGYLKQGVKFA